MRATIKADRNSINRSHRKENHFLSEISTFVMDGKELKNVVTLRIYGTNAKNYVCIWIYSDKIHTSGSGSAGGYGCHRPSEAAAEAISNAGIELSVDISGRGESTMIRAAEAITRACYPRRKVYSHEAHA